jgi:ABC-type glycerol-3-phosphate transport system permease component
MAREQTATEIAPNPVRAARARRRPTKSGVGIYLAFAVFIFVMGFPLYFVVISAFTPEGQLLHAPPNFLPSTLTLGNFDRLFVTMPVGKYALNSLIFATASSVVSVVVGFLAAYAFARYEFRGRQFFFILFMASAAFPAISLVIPLFRTFRDLGFVNSILGLTIVVSSTLLPLTIWILASYIRQIPRELEEVARVDGQRLPMIMLKIVAPLAVPALVTLFVINFIITWNEIFYPLVLISTDDAKPLALRLLEASTSQVSGGGAPWNLLSAFSLLLLVPTVVLGIVCQKLIIEGLTRGAVK